MRLSLYTKISATYIRYRKRMSGSNFSLSKGFITWRIIHYRLIQYRTFSKLIESLYFKLPFYLTSCHVYNKKEVALFQSIQQFPYRGIQQDMIFNFFDNFNKISNHYKQTIQSDSYTIYFIELFINTLFHKFNSSISS